MNGKTHFQELHGFAREQGILCTIGSDCHFNGKTRFGYSVVPHRGGKERLIHYHISQDFFESLKKKIDVDILPLLNH